MFIFHSQTESGFPYLHLENKLIWMNSFYFLGIAWELNNFQEI